MGALALRIFSAFQAHNRALSIAVVALAISGCGGGHDASQLVKEPPAAVYAAFEAAFSANSLNGAQQFADQWNGAMQTEVEKTPDSKLDVITKFDGQMATEAHFTFTPQDGGRATLVEADVNVDQQVMHKALAGTAHQQLGNLPTAAFAIGMQKLMSKYASRIESGMPLNVPGEGWQTGAGEPPEEFYEGMSPEMRAEIRRHDEEQRQQATAAPTSDPNADAQAYLHPHGSSD
jgi:hypothetical protein